MDSVSASEPQVAGVEEGGDARIADAHFHLGHFAADAGGGEMEHRYHPRRVDDPGQRGFVLVEGVEAEGLGVVVEHEEIVAVETVADAAQEVGV
jgi:hypothetical protein